MKKIINIFIIMLFVIIMAGCNVSSGTKYSVIMPTGAPSIALADFTKNYSEELDVEIVNGSDPLVSAFTKGDYDIIVAPVNLGAKLYNSREDFEYVLYKPIVGCNYYILSSEISEFSELEGKEMVGFGEASTPGVMLKTLISHYGLNVNVTYQNSVNEANGLLVAEKAKTIITAEPSKTIISKGKDYSVIDIAALWKEMAGSEYDVPQAGIFVKKSFVKRENVQNILANMEASIELAYSNPTLLAESAIAVDANFAKQTVENLAAAIPNCNFLTKDLNREEVEYYFNKIIELGLGASVGGKLPDEGFYY